MSLSKSPTSEMRVGRRCSRDYDSWKHIQDPKQRKKVQNRIAQRQYRERLRKHIAALELLRDEQSPTPCQQSNAGALAFDNATSTTSSVPESNSSDNHSRECSSPTTSNCNSIENEYGALPSISSLSPTFSSEHCPRRSESGRVSSSPLSISSDMNSLLQLPDQDSMIPTSLTSAIDTTLLLNDFSDFPGGYNTYDQPAERPSWEIGSEMGMEHNFSVSSKIPGLGSCQNGSVKSRSLESLSALDDVQQRRKENFQTGKTALHIAAEKGQSSTVRLLLNLNSKTSAQDQLGRTALHLAVYNSHLKAAEELLKVATLDLQILDSTGRAPLHAAVTSGNRELVLSLLGAGADIEYEDSLGRTAFHLAVLAGSDDMIRLLSDRGANINSVINQSVVSGSRTQ